MLSLERLFSRLTVEQESRAKLQSCLQENLSELGIQNKDKIIFFDSEVEHKRTVEQYSDLLQDHDSLKLVRIDATGRAIGKNFLNGYLKAKERYKKSKAIIENK